MIAGLLISTEIVAHGAVYVVTICFSARCRNVLLTFSEIRPAVTRWRRCVVDPKDRSVLGRRRAPARLGTVLLGQRSDHLFRALFRPYPRHGHPIDVDRLLAQPDPESLFRRRRWQRLVVCRRRRRSGYQRRGTGFDRHRLQ